MTKRKNETDSRRKYFQGTNFNKIIWQFSSAQSRNATKSTFVHWQIWFNSDTPEKIRWILKVAYWSREIAPLSQISVMRHLGLLVAWCNAEKVMFTWSTVRSAIDQRLPTLSTCRPWTMAKLCQKSFHRNVLCTGSPPGQHLISYGKYRWYCCLAQMAQDPRSSLIFCRSKPGVHFDAISKTLNVKSYFIYTYGKRYKTCT